MNQPRNLNEGGNIFKQQDGTELTRRINQNEVAPTVSWLESITGLDLTKEKAQDGLPSKWLGSTGRKPTSGDLDLAINANEVTKADLENKLKAWATQNNLDPKEFVKKSGISVHFAAPIEGNFEKGFVQTDFMFLTNLEWETWLLSGGMRSPSEYKGVFREVALNSVAKGTITNEHPQGLRLSSKGVVDRATGELVTLDPEVAAKLLFGKDGTLDDISSVENIYKKLKNDPNKQQKLKDFEEYATRSGVAPPKFGDKTNESAYDIIAKFRNLVVENSVLMEAGPRIPHPEDAIFDGSSEAKKYLEALKQAIADPKSGSIKWDGGIALFFGRLADGTFVVTDKYMPDKGMFPKSPQEWIQYDQSRGANRADLYDKIKLIWPGLEQAVGNTKGLFKGDLLFTGRLKPIKGYYVFAPVTVEYRVPVSSDMGRMLKDKVGAVVVHQFNDKPWSGSPPLKSTSVALIEPKAGIDFNIKKPTKLIQNAEQAINKYGSLADRFFESLPKTVKDAIKKFANHQITKQTTDTLLPWLEKNTSAKQYEFLVGNNDGYLIKNKAGLDAVFAIWNAIYQLKLNIAQQLEPQVQGFEQWTGGKPEGEGFVFPTNAGLVKIVNREGFGAAHFNK
jgi:hypothetical protein